MCVCVCIEWEDESRSSKLPVWVGHSSGGHLCVWVAIVTSGAGGVSYDCVCCAAVDVCVCLFEVLINIAPSFRRTPFLVVVGAIKSGSAAAGSAYL